MKKNKQTGRVASEKVRGILSELADAICNAQDKVVLGISGNTFEIHLDGGTINISVDMKGGQA